MTIRLPTPTPRQREFLQASTPYVAYGGARGGGKSFAVRLKSVSLALAHPGVSMLILRRTLPELQSNHINNMIAMTTGLARFRDADKTLTFVNGSTVKFGYCDAERDVNRYQGQEYDVIFFDEATHFTEQMFVDICTCRRGANDYPKRIYCTCNPGGVGHGWVKRLFVDRAYRGDERPEDYTFIRSTVYDNAPLLARDPEYVRMLQNLPDKRRRAWLEGDWDAFEGQFFAEFARETHVCEPFATPDYWTRVVSMDYGLDMLAVLWGAFDERGGGVIYRELCEPGLIVSEAAAKIRALCNNEQSSKIMIAAPPDLWSRQKDSGLSIAELFLREGITLYRADNNRRGGWANLREWLRPIRDADGEERPRLRIFANCTNLIRSLPALQYDARDSLDCAGEPHDVTHSPDALRYMLQTRPRPGIERPDADANGWLDDYKRSLFRSAPKTLYR